jgi:DUF1016 N-terminal domain
MARKTRDAALTSTGLPSDYPAFLESLKSRIRQAQTKAMLSVNREMIQLYWDIGREIVDRQERAGWGQSVLERLADDLQKALPGVSGFSRSNVFRMRAFYVAYRPPQKVAQPVRQPKPSKKVAQVVPQLVEDVPPGAVSGIPWGHNVVLLQKVKEPRGSQT